MNVSLYDLLDVEPTASADQIRAAWKAAIADLDPTDRRFRAYNDAAGVLLDADKRAAYDAELAAVPAESEDAGEPIDEPADDATAVEGEPADEAPTAVAPVVVPDDEPEDEADEADEAAAAAATSDAPASGPSSWVLYLAGGLAVLSAVLMVLVLTWPGSLGGDSPADRQDQAEEAETAAVLAERAAAEAIPVVLSYDYRTLEEDFAAAEEYLTPEFAEKRATLFAQAGEGGITLAEQVVADKVVVAAVESGTGLTRVSEDGTKATVVVFVDQDSQRGNAAPRSLRMWATLSMVADGDDWLLADICTESDCS